MKPSASTSPVPQSTTTVGRKRNIDEVTGFTPYISAQPTKQSPQKLQQNPTTVTTLEDIITDIGFETFVEDNGDLVLTGYSDKMGQEDVLIGAIGQFATSDSYFEWRGEDGTFYKWMQDDEDGIIVFNGSLVWD